MSLLVEDGSIVPNADTYSTLDELRAFAAKRGVTVPADDGECEVLLIKAMDWLAAQSERWKGERVQWDQPLDWPRYCVVVNGYELPSDAIPADIKNGQCQLAIDAQTVDLMPNATVGQLGAVIEKTIDVITTRYAEPQTQRTVPVLARVNGFLSKYFASGANQVKLVRG